MIFERVPEMSFSLVEAHKTAQAEGRPTFFRSEYYTDGRGWSLMNQLRGVLSVEGQVNYSVQYPGVVKAWHRHREQTDFWICVSGHIRVGVHEEASGHCWSMVIGERRPGTLIVPAGLWHGAGTVGGEPASLLYYVSRAYDPAAPDEERRAPRSVPGFSWALENR